ncbi:MAG: phage portal protein, partial [Clostridia bacterium]
DIRELENMNPIPADEGGDSYLCNGNLITIRTAMENNGASVSAMKTEDAT